MATLLLRLAGPLQSWGVRSRFVTRGTERAPSKSGVIGLLAAARGQLRTEPLDELRELTFGVRVDQPGELVRDFQTEASLDRKQVMPLSYRHYVGDAVFLAAVEHPELAFLEELKQALARPVFPLSLGRRSCPPDGPILTWIEEGDLLDSLSAAPWQASKRYQRASPEADPVLRILVDGRPGDEAAEQHQDDPISFNPERREYGWRAVSAADTRVPNLYFAGERAASHDPFELLGEEA